MAGTKLFILVAASLLVMSSGALQQKAKKGPDVSYRKLTMQKEMNACMDELELDEMTEPGAAHNCSCKCQKDDDCSCSCTTTDARDAEKKACNKSPVSRKGRAAERQNSPEDKEIDARNMEKMSQCLEKYAQADRAAAGALVAHRGKRWGWRLVCWLTNCYWKRVWFFWVRVCTLTCQWQWYWG